MGYFDERFLAGFAGTTTKAFVPLRLLGKEARNVWRRHKARRNERMTCAIDSMSQHQLRDIGLAEICGHQPARYGHFIGLRHPKNLR